MWTVLDPTSKCLASDRIHAAQPVLPDHASPEFFLLLANSGRQPALTDTWLPEQATRESLGSLPSQRRHLENG